MTDTNNKATKSERLNFIIAVCAVLISAASFYATYIQADAAEKQVRAMTLPLLQFVHSNWDDAKEESILTFALQNGGAGPAVLHNVSFHYEKQNYSTVREWVDACCAAEVASVKSQWQAVKAANSAVVDPFQFITTNLSNVIITGQYKYDFLHYERTDLNTPLWNALNTARHSTELQTCYCSLLEECYQAKGLVDVTPVNACD